MQLPNSWGVLRPPIGGAPMAPRLGVYQLPHMYYPNQCVRPTRMGGTLPPCGGTTFGGIHIPEYHVST